MTQTTAPITFSEMVRKLAKPGDAIVDSMTPEKADMLHMAIGLSGEIAELVQAELSGDLKNRCEEAGDAEFYFEKLRDYATPVYLPEFKITEATNVVDSLVICAGEILDLTKKYVIYNKPLKTDEFNAIMAEFSATMAIYYALAPFTRADAIAHNMDKLLTGSVARYKSGEYSDQQAHDRADKA